MSKRYFDVSWDSAFNKPVRRSPHPQNQSPRMPHRYLLGRSLQVQPHRIRPVPTDLYALRRPESGSCWNSQCNIKSSPTRSARWAGPPAPARGNSAAWFASKYKSEDRNGIHTPDENLVYRSNVDLETLRPGVFVGNNVKDLSIGKIVINSQSHSVGPRHKPRMTGLDRTR